MDTTRFAITNNSNTTPFRVRLAGGLGNQLFQITAATYYSNIWGRPWILDDSQLKPELAPHGSSIASFEFRNHHKTEHSHFLQMWFSLVEHKRFTHPNSKFGEGSIRLLENFLNIYRSPVNGYDELLENVKPLPDVISGYFQSWKYPASVFATNPGFKRQLTLTKTSRWFQELSRSADFSHPVSLHVRRGDYRNSRSFGLLGRKYYSRAIERIQSLHSGRVIWVFSDEPEAARELLLGTTTFRLEFIEPPMGTDPAESLILMSRCSGHIIANSSFSWWGAFLGKSGPVVAPDKWFPGRLDPKELIPPRWHRVPSFFEN